MVWPGMMLLLERLAPVREPTALGDFEADTRVSGGDGRYTATLVDDWAIWGPNGGYIASVALRAAGAESAFSRPATFKCQFLAPGRFDAVDITVQSIRRGRNAEALSVVLTQGDRTLLSALAWTVPDVDEQTPRMEHDFAPMPDVPPNMIAVLPLTSMSFRPCFVVILINVR